MSVFWGDGRIGRKPANIQAQRWLKVRVWRFIVKATVAAVLLGFTAEMGSAVPAYGAVGPAHGAPGTKIPSPKGTHLNAEAFLHAAEALYKAAVSGNVFETRLSLRQTEVKLRSLPMQRIATAEGIEALAKSVAGMKRTMAAVSVDAQKWIDGAAEIRLAADALAHPEAPLWHDYRKVLQEDTASLAAAIAKTGVSKTSASHFDSLQRHYQLIRTSVLLHSEPFLAERADSILRYTQRLLGNAKTDPVLLADLATPLNNSMDGLFPRQENDQAAIVPPVAGPPWGWSAFMGTFIVSVLTWVGWRRYQRVDRITPRESLPRERHQRR